MRENTQLLYGLKITLPHVETQSECGENNVGTGRLATLLHAKGVYEAQLYVPSSVPSSGKILQVPTSFYFIVLRSTLDCLVCLYTFREPWPIIVKTGSY
jgi:hypothetical protein